MGQLMNTKEVAEYLGIHEKKVYHLAKMGKIPCTRVTGKWIFPKNLIDQWVEESVRGLERKPRQDEKRSLLAAGSDDPSLGILRELYTKRPPAPLFLATTGSTAGLVAVRDGIADVALAHLLDPLTGEYNLPYVRELLPSGAVAVLLFYRELGLVAKSGNPLGIRAVADLARPGVRIINRQQGSGTRLYLDQELARLGINPRQVNGYDDHVTTHMEVGIKVLRGEAGIGLATRATARLLGLEYVPLTRECFDILIAKDRFFFPSVQALLNIVGSREFRTRVEALGGYDTSESGRILSSDLSLGKDFS